MNISTIINQLENNSIYELDLFNNKVTEQELLQNRIRRCCKNSKCTIH